MKIIQKIDDPTQFVRTVAYVNGELVIEYTPYQWEAMKYDIIFASMFSDVLVDHMLVERHKDNRHWVLYSKVNKHQYFSSKGDSADFTSGILDAQIFTTKELKALNDWAYTGYTAIPLQQAVEFEIAAKKLQITISQKDIEEVEHWLATKIKCAHEWVDTAAFPPQFSRRCMKCGLEQSTMKTLTVPDWSVE